MQRGPIGARPSSRVLPSACPTGPGEIQSKVQIKPARWCGSTILLYPDTVGTHASHKTSPHSRPTEEHSLQNIIYALNSEYVLSSRLTKKPCKSHRFNPIWHCSSVSGFLSPYLSCFLHIVWPGKSLCSPQLAPQPICIPGDHS